VLVDCRPILGALATLHEVRLISRSHQERTAMENAAKPGYTRGVRTRISTRKPRIGRPLLTFMVRRSPWVRVPWGA